MCVKARQRCYLEYLGVAQSIERLPWGQDVVGLSPATQTKRIHTSVLLSDSHHIPNEICEHTLVLPIEKHEIFRFGVGVSLAAIL